VAAVCFYPWCSDGDSMSCKISMLARETAYVRRSLLKELFGRHACCVTVPLNCLVQKETFKISWLSNVFLSGSRRQQHVNSARDRNNCSIHLTTLPIVRSPTQSAVFSWFVQRCVWSTRSSGHRSCRLPLLTSEPACRSCDLVQGNVERVLRKD
jgi:hypothetical protein